MSIKQMSQVWEHAITDDPSTLLVLLALADWANDQGVCWPAMESIAEKCRISERTAQRIIKHMEVCGILEVVRKRGRKHTNTYKLKVPTRQVFFDLKGVTDDELEFEKVTETEEKVTKTHGKGDTAMSPEPSEPPKPEPSSTKAVGKFQLPGWVPKHDWDDWLEVRKKKRVPETVRALELAVSKLAKLQNKGHPPEKVLQLAIERGWTGLFEPWEQTGNGNSKAQQRQDDSNNAIKAAADRLKRKAAGCGESSVPEPNHDHRNGGTVLDGVWPDSTRVRVATAGRGNAGGDS